MRTIGNILWLILNGFWMAIAWAFIGVLLSITIILLPFGRQCFKLANFALWPFGRTAVPSPTALLRQRHRQHPLVHPRAPARPQLRRLRCAAVHHDHRHPVRDPVVQVRAACAVPVRQGDRQLPRPAQRHRRRPGDGVSQLLQLDDCCLHRPDTASSRNRSPQRPARSATLRRWTRSIPPTSTRASSSTCTGRFGGRCPTRIRDHLDPAGAALIPLFIPEPVPPRHLGRVREHVDERGRTLRVSATSSDRDEAARLQTTMLRYEIVDGDDHQVIERPWVLHWHAAVRAPVLRAGN